VQKRLQLIKKQLFFARIKKFKPLQYKIPAGGPDLIGQF